jgi:hypothetical protein
VTGGRKLARYVLVIRRRTALLTGAIRSFAANEPCPVLVLLPTESDSRDDVVADVGTIFAATPVRGTLKQMEDGERKTLLHRRFPGSSVKIVAARPPRNLRRHRVRALKRGQRDMSQ